eukprot:4371890-Amphidinium_carterae.1
MSAPVLSGGLESWMMYTLAQDVSRVGLPVALHPIESFYASAATCHYAIPALLPWISIAESAPLVTVLRAVSPEMLAAVSNDGVIFGGYVESVRDRLASVVVPNRGQLKIASRVKRSAPGSAVKSEEEKRSRASQK